MGAGLWVVCGGAPPLPRLASSLVVVVVVGSGNVPVVVASVVMLLNIKGQKVVLAGLQQSPITTTPILKAVF